MTKEEYPPPPPLDYNVNYLYENEGFLFNYNSEGLKKDIFCATPNTRLTLSSLGREGPQLNCQM